MDVELMMIDDRYFNMYAEFYKVKVLLNVHQNLQDMEKSHDAFLQGAQLELKKEMATLQKKILMDTVSRAKLQQSKEGNRATFFGQGCCDRDGHQRVLVGKCTITDSTKLEALQKSERHVSKVQTFYFPLGLCVNALTFVSTAAAGDGRSSQVTAVHAVLMAFQLEGLGLI